MTNLDIREIQLKILKESKPIRVRGLLKKRKEPLKQFIRDFLETHNHENETIYVEGGSTQTEPGKRRSIGDIFMICQYYYPDCTLDQVRHILVTELPAEMDNFRSSHCHTINKRVFYVDPEFPQAGIYDKTTHDEFGKPWREWTEVGEVAKKRYTLPEEETVFHWKLQGRH